MWKKGLLNETRKLLDQKSNDNHFLESTIGYAEAAAYLKKEITEPEALEKIFRRTRQYAKRQWTWFKHQHEVQWINLDDFPTVVSMVDELGKRIKLS
jgi:tRNA dimethylallyltransferase